MIRRGLLVWSACLALGCPSDPAPRDECQGDPDFFVTVTNELGRLPIDLRVKVEYGGGTETYSFAPADLPEVVFCSKKSHDGGAGGAAAEAPPAAGDAGSGGASAAPAESLECQLWTEGPATIEVNALGFEPIERDLRVDLEVCTTAVTLDLVREKAPE